MVRRPHDCVRCGETILPGDVYSVVDVLDAEGRLAVLLCRECGVDLRSFIDGNGDGDADAAAADSDAEA